MVQILNVLTVNENVFAKFETEQSSLSQWTLSATLSFVVIKEANEAVRTVRSESKRRGSYAKFTPEQQAAIGKYDSLHGNQAAI